MSHPLFQNSKDGGKKKNKNAGGDAGGKAEVGASVIVSQCLHIPITTLVEVSIKISPEYTRPLTASLQLFQNGL